MCLYTLAFGPYNILAYTKKHLLSNFFFGGGGVQLFSLMRPTLNSTHSRIYCPTRKAISLLTPSALSSHLRRLQVHAILYMTGDISRIF